MTEILNTYNEKGLLKSIIQKKFGLLLSSLLHQYDEKGRLKLVAQRSLRKWPSTPAEAAALTASSSLSYDTSFVAYAYNGEGQLILERRLNTQSVVTAATYYEYTDLELDRAYTLNEEKDTVTGLFYEKERDGITKETAVYAGLDQTTTAWKNGDRILQEITLGMNGRSKHTYSYSKRGHLIEERTYH